MANAFIIEHRDLAAGIAVRERGGSRFHSSDALFLTIETQRFRRLREIELAVKRVVHTRALVPRCRLGRGPTTRHSDESLTSARRSLVSTFDRCSAQAVLLTDTAW